MFSKISIEIINSLTLNELEVLRFVDYHKKELQDMTIYDLSEATFSSTATIIRLCKKIGLSGFSELKYFVKTQVLNVEEQDADKSYESILSSKMALLGKLDRYLDKQKVLKVVEKLKSDMRVHFFAKGMTCTVVEYFSKLLLTKNRKNFIYTDTHIAYLSADNMDENDLLILCSASGNTHQVVRMAHIAKSRNAFIVAITEKASNQLSKIGDVNFCTCYDNSESDNIMDISSRIPIMFILEFIMDVYFNS